MSLDNNTIGNPPGIIPMPPTPPVLTNPTEVEAARKVRQSPEYRELKNQLSNPGYIPMPDLANGFKGTLLTAETLDKWVDQRVHEVATHTGGAVDSDYIATIVRGNVQALLDARESRPFLKI